MLFKRDRYADEKGENNRSEERQIICHIMVIWPC